MITNGSSFVLDHLNCSNPHKLLRFGKILPILTLGSKHKNHIQLLVINANE